MVTKAIPKKEKFKKAKCLSEEALQISRKEDKRGKGERERYTQLNVGLQRIARRDKKAFLSEQCKEMEENNRVEKNKDMVKKMGDIKETFHARMCMIKDRNGKDLPEAEEVKKWWQKYTEELYKKGLNDLDNHNGAVTHLEPDILECEVKWTLGSITRNKASGGDETQLSYLKS